MTMTPPDPAPSSADEAPETVATPSTTSFGPASSFAPAQAFIPPPVRRQRAGLMTSVLLGTAAAVAVGGIAFAAGRLTAPPSTTAAATGRFGGQNGQPFANASGRPGFGGGNGGFRAAFGGLGVRGTVTSVSGDTLTVRLANGQEVKVQTDSSTTYHKQASASASDVTSGSQVIVELQAGNGFGFGGQGGGSTPTIKASDVTVAGQ